MFKRGEREFISDKLLELDLKEIEKALEDNNKAFSMGNDIVTIYKEGDRFETRKISSFDSNYMVMHTLQNGRFRKWIDICKTIQDYIKKSDEEVDKLMNEVYENVALSYKFEEPSVEDIFDDNSEVDSVINSLTEKASMLEKVTKETQVNEITIRRAKRLYDTIGEVNHYYDKLEKLSSDEDILGFYEENSEYIEEDLVLDIDYLNKKLSEYKNIHDEGKPFVFVRGDEVKVLTSELDDYDMAFNYMISEIEIAIQKASVIKDKNFVHDYVVESVRDHSMEMIFDEVLNTSIEIDNLIKSGDDFNISMMILWIDASVKILNNLKDKLKEDYNNGNKIKVSSLENGRYIVTEEENTLENYEKQLKFLDETINKCMDINDRLIGLDDTKVPVRVSSDVKSKYVVVLNNGKVTVISANMSDEEIQNIDSPLINEAKENGLDIEFAVNLGSGLHSVNGNLLEIKNDGTIIMGYRSEKMEFHNQEEKIKTYEDIMGEPDADKTHKDTKNEHDTDKTMIRKPIDVDEAKKVVKRKKNNGLIQKFKGLKRWQKVAIVAGLTLAGVAVVGVGVYHLVPEVRPLIDGFIQNLHIPNIGQPTTEIVQSPVRPSDVAPQMPQAASVDYSSFGEGHRVFTDAYSASSGINSLEANMWFNNNPIDVFNADINDFMHLTSEQLHDAELLKTLANDPNNVLLFGADMANPDGFVPLSDVVGEMVKGGKIL